MTKTANELIKKEIEQTTEKPKSEHKDDIMNKEECERYHRDDEYYMIIAVVMAFIFVINYLFKFSLSIVLIYEKYVWIYSINKISCF